MRPQWTYIPAGSGVRQNAYPCGLGYHSQSEMRTDKSPCPLGWDPGCNIYPVSRGLQPFAVSSEKQYLFELWILILYLARNAFLEQKY